MTDDIITEPGDSESVKRLNQRCEYCYMKLKLVFERVDVTVDMGPAQFKAFLLSAMQTMFGEVGKASLDLQLLKYDEKDLSGIIRIQNSMLVKVWSAFSLVGHCATLPCAIRVHQVSQHLIALSNNSRNFHH